MAMGTGESGGSMAEINLTPMIDVLLVLLIIFMVIVPAIPRGLPTILPQRPLSSGHPDPEKAVVIQVERESGAPATYKINGTAVAHAAILEKLTEIYADRADRVLFVAGDDQVKFADVADVVAIGRAANADRIGLMTPGSRLVQ